MKVLDLAIHGKLVPQDPNDEPASELLKRINPKAVATSDTHHYEKVPKGWSVCHLNEIADIALGKTLDKQRNKGDYMPYLRSVNVRWGYTELSDIKEMRFEPSEIDRYKVIRGDLLICEGGEAGRSAVWEGIDIQYQNAIHRVRFKDKIDPYFYMYSLHYYSENHFLENFCKGVTIKHLTGQALKQISFPLPPLAEQKRIVDKIAQIFAQLDIIVAEL
jgi:type I restriction enzyme S subunit